MCEHYDYLGSRRDGGFAEYCLLPSKWQLIVAKNASMEELAMTEPACVAQHAVRRADVQAGQYVVISKHQSALLAAARCLNKEEDIGVVRDGDQSGTYHLSRH